MLAGNPIALTTGLASGVTLARPGRGLYGVKGMTGLVGKFFCWACARPAAAETAMLIAIAVDNPACCNSFMAPPFAGPSLILLMGVRKQV